MKRILVVLSLLQLMSRGFSQDCGNSLYFRPNTQFTYLTTFKKGGTLEGTYKTTRLEQSGKWKLASVNSVFSENGKHSNAFSGKIQCDGSVIRIDFRYFAGETGDDFNGSYFEYPVKMIVGQNLPDQKMAIDFKGTNGEKSRMDLEVLERKIIGKETITTPAGKFNCFVISTLQVSGFTNSEKVKRIQKEWYAPEYGLIQTDSDLATMQLTSLVQK